MITINLLGMRDKSTKISDTGCVLCKLSLYLLLYYLFVS
jgi:hypothetical protein